MRLDPIRSTEQVQQGTKPAARGVDAGGFQQALQAAQARQETAPPAGVEFSKHALERLEQRGIRLDSTLLGRLGDGVDRAAAKGSRTTLVLVDQTAFVVGVDQRTVVTVADQASLKERVFTNIDSLVIA